MAIKPPIFHPYTTNTGQVLLSDLVVYPKSSIYFLFTPGGGGILEEPYQLTEEPIGEGLVLLVYSPVDLLVSFDDITLPSLPGTPINQANTIILAGGQYHLLQWPTQYFTPLPVVTVAADAYVLVNTIQPQNSTGDAYKLDNR